MTASTASISRKHLIWASSIGCVGTLAMAVFDGRTRQLEIGALVPLVSLSCCVASLVALSQRKDLWGGVWLLSVVCIAPTLVMILGGGLDGIHPTVLLCSIAVASAILGGRWVLYLAACLVVITGGLVGMRLGGVAPMLAELPKEAVVTYNFLGVSFCAILLGGQARLRPTTVRELTSLQRELDEVTYELGLRAMLIQGLREIDSLWFVTLDLESADVIYVGGDWSSLGINDPMGASGVRLLVSLFQDEDAQLIRAILGAEMGVGRHIFRTRQGLWLEVRSGKKIALKRGSHTIVFQRAMLSPKSVSTVQSQLNEGLRNARLAAVGQLSGGLRHRINNSFTGINQLVWLAKSGMEEGSISAQDLDDLRPALDSAAEITHQLRALSLERLDDQVRLDLGVHVQKSLSLLGRLLPPTIKLNLRMELDQAWVELDIPALQQIMLNLVVNGRDAIEGEGEITVRVARDDSDIVLSVQDSGLGMDEVTRHRCLDLFFTTKEEKGSGIGLAVVAGNVRRIGGEISVISAVGEGSTFEVRIPERAPPSANPLKKEVPEPVTTVTEEVGRRQSILVVEDDKAIRRLISRVLLRGGFDVTVVEDGFLALEQYEPDTFDIVITDMAMPNMSGADLIAQIQEVDPDQVVMLMTGHAPDDVRNRLTDGVHVLLKPFHPTTLLERLEVLLSDSETE